MAWMYSLRDCGAGTRGLCSLTTPPRPECYSSSVRPIPGPREPDTRRQRSLPPFPGSNRGGGGAPLPQRDRSPTLPRRLSPSPGRGSEGGADCPQCSPGVVAPSGLGGRRSCIPPPGGRSRAHGVGGDLGYPHDPSCNMDLEPWGPAIIISDIATCYLGGLGFYK